VKKYPLVLLLLVLLLGCQPLPDSANTPAPTATKSFEVVVPTPAIISTPTSTPQPSLKEHEWTPQTVLLRLDLTREENGILNPPPPPQFILYADGKVLLTRPAIEGYPHGDQQLVFKQLERKEVCQILNTLDQTGFLDYDPSSYEFIGGKPNMTGVTNAYLEVNAWKSHKREYPELPFYIFDELTGVVASGLTTDINDRNGFPVISPALRNAYYLTADYPVDGFEVYEPERFAVWIRPLKPADFPNVHWEDWSSQSYAISYMLSRIDYGNAGYDERYLILRKQGALSLYEYLKEAFSTKYYVETGKLGEKAYYAVHARPLLPYELPGTYEVETPETSNPKLKCAPADGVMTVPTPSLIYTLPIP
jgi:hypothetical protein